MRIRSVFSHALAAVAEGSLIALLIVGLMAGTAFAGRPAGNGPSPSTSATLIPDCNPCATGVVVHFTGSGYDGSQGTAQLYVGGPAAAIPVNADGTIAFGWWLSATGSYDFRVYQSGKGNKLVMKSQVIVVAQ